MTDLPLGGDISSALARNPLREQIRQVLLDGLLSGRWKPGERIVERRVAVEMQVSQAPVREALRELESLRLIETVPNKGARVRAFGRAELAEIYPVRAGLEEVAAELAAPWLASDVSVLQREVELLRQAAERDDVNAEIKHSVDFHREIVRAARNSVLLHTWESLGVEVWTAISLRWLGMGLHSKVSDHDSIARAFLERDPDVGRMLRRHVLNYAEAALKAPEGQDSQTGESYGGELGPGKSASHIDR